jgi:hypothetical protein
VRWLDGRNGRGWSQWWRSGSFDEPVDDLPSCSREPLERSVGDELPAFLVHLLPSDSEAVGDLVIIEIRCFGQDLHDPIRDRHVSASQAVLDERGLLLGCVFRVDPGGDLEVPEAERRVEPVLGSD